MIDLSIRFFLIILNIYCIYVTFKCFTLWHKRQDEMKKSLEERIQKEYNGVENEDNL